MSPEKKRAMIKRDHPQLSISHQCKLVCELPRFAILVSLQRFGIHLGRLSSFLRPLHLADPELRQKRKNNSVCPVSYIIQKLLTLSQTYSVLVTAPSGA